MSNHLFLSIGSNRSYEDVINAIEWLKKKLFNTRISSLYKTPPVQGHGKPYVNAVMEGKINMDLDDFNCELKKFEISSGRDEIARAAGIVPVDIDIVISNGEVLRKRDYVQSFFKIGYLELAGSIIED